MTGSLREDLLEIGAVANSAQLPDADVVRTLGDRRRRRRNLTATGAAGLAGTLLVVALTQPWDSDRHAAPATPVSPSHGTDRTPGPGSTFHTIATGPQRFGAHAVAARGERFVVVGDSSTLDGPAGPPVYWSDDGAHWRPPLEGHAPASVNVTDVIATDQGFLAVGITTEGQAAVWRSAAGRSWTMIPGTASATGTPSSFWGLTETRLGFFASGFAGRRAQLWRSTDGSTWWRVGEGSVFDLPQRETICAVRDVGKGLRATGMVAPPGSRGGHRVSWTSDDGESWVRETTSGPDAIWCDPTGELGHWEASTEAGQVRIDPYGSGEAVELVPPEK